MNDMKIFLLGLTPLILVPIAVIEILDPAILVAFIGIILTTLCAVVKILWGRLEKYQADAEERLEECEKDRDALHKMIIANTQNCQRLETIVQELK